MLDVSLTKKSTLLNDTNDNNNEQIEADDENIEIMVCFGGIWVERTRHEWMIRIIIMIVIIIRIIYDKLLSFPLVTARVFMHHRDRPRASHLYILHHSTFIAENCVVGAIRLCYAVFRSHVCANISFQNEKKI